MNQESAQKALACVADDALIRFIQDFIRINSVNPNLEPGSSEAAAVEYLAQACREAGLLVTIDEVAPGRPNLYCVLPGAQDGISLAFLGHTDTVPFLGMDNPLSGEIQDGYIWGRGGVDMKGGVTASIQALLALRRSGVRLRKGVALWAVIDEESEHRGAYALEQGMFQADACIVTEPSDLRLLLGCKGTAPVRIDLEGVLAHGSNPWLGVNAIDKAARVILALEHLEPRSIHIPELDMRVQGSVNVGVIRGGTQYNNVADSCSMFLDRRMAPGETQASVLAEINQILETLAAEDPKFKARAEISRPDWHWEPIIRRGLNPAYTPPGSPVVGALRASYRQVKGEDVTMGYTHGYMDMDFTVNGLGIPTVNFGPGETAYSHTANERLRIADLLAATRIYILAALSMAS
jgi:acetylornithine deacetylase/succinyl-diaminopimelate desuccinylase family protein